MVLIPTECLLTHKDVADKRGGQTEDNDQDVGNGQVDNEVVGDSAHTRSTQDDGDDKAVADESDDEHHDVGHTVDNGHCQRVAIERIEAKVHTSV